MAKVYFLIGGNLGNREQILKDTIALLQIQVGTVVECSSVYETEPWGFRHELNFLNQLVVVETELLPFAVLHQSQEIEKKMGRVRHKEQYSARTIDVDILFYDDEIVSTDWLQIPHPRIQERLFALLPLQEINPDLIHPLQGKTISQLCTECEDTSKVKKRS